MASDAQTGLRRIWPAGYSTPAAIGRAIKLYITAQSCGINEKLSTEQQYILVTLAHKIKFHPVDNAARQITEGD